MFSFRSACLVTGGLFVLLSAVVLVLTSTMVEQYIYDRASWALAVDHFRFIAALNLTVGVLLLAFSRGNPDPQSSLWVGFAMCACMGLLAGVHVLVLATNTATPTGSPRWNPTLYADTAFFSLVALYWAGVAVRLTRPAPSPGRIAA